MAPFFFASQKGSHWSLLFLAPSRIFSLKGNRQSGNLAKASLEGLGVLVNFWNITELRLSNG